MGFVRVNGRGGRARCGLATVRLRLLLSCVECQEFGVGIGLFSGCAVGFDFDEENPWIGPGFIRGGFGGAGDCARITHRYRFGHRG